MFDLKRYCWGVLFSALLCGCAFAQNEAANQQQDLAATVSAMQKQIQELQSAVLELREQSDTYRRESENLRRDLARTSGTASPVASQADIEPDVAYQSVQPDAQRAVGQAVSLEDELRLLAGKINDQYQTKVESGSKYRVKLSGMVLLNLFGNRGTVDSIDTPGIAEPQSPLFGNGAFGGTLRQSQVGIDVFGPNWVGAKVTGNLRFDFAGGFPDANNGVTLGLVRLRTGTIRLEWPSTSVVAGQDVPFISPLSPTSLAQLVEPAFSYAGNLWTWIPQVRVEHRMRITEGQKIVLEGGILDSLTGDNPIAQAERAPHAGEVSRQPAYAARIAWQRGEGDTAWTIGVGGYYGRQDWGFGRNVDGWAGTADWSLPLGSRFALSGEFYRGRGIGGLGAATYHSVLSSGVLNNSQSKVQGLDVVGGWSQLKFRATSTLQFNAAYGIDNPFARQLRAFNAVQNLLDPDLGKNQAAMFNFIYRPRSNLLFSTEYRHIDSVRLNQAHFTAEHVNMSIGVLF